MSVPRATLTGTAKLRLGQGHPQASPPALHTVGPSPPWPGQSPLFPLGGPRPPPHPFGATFPSPGWLGWKRGGVSSGRGVRGGGQQGPLEAQYAWLAT